MFLKKKQKHVWQQTEISTGARSESSPSGKISREYEHPERQQANAYTNLRRILVKDFLLFLFSKVTNTYRVAQTKRSIPATLRRKGLHKWENQEFTIGFNEMRVEQYLMENGGH